MKKLIFLIITIFLFLPNTLALSKFVIGDKVPNFYVERISYNDMHNGAVFMLKRDDGGLVYCIEPFEPNILNNYYSEYNYNNYLFNLNDVQLNRINLIAYFGYGYKNHTDIKWYGVTQFLIWKELNLKDIYFTDRYHGVKTIMYEDEISEIESLVNNYYELPSIVNEEYNYTINSEYEVHDINNILNNYEIESSNIESRIEDNTLYIKTSTIGNYTINFKRKSPIDRDYKLYYLNNSQSLIYPGKIDEIQFSININVSSGSITINKIDSENINRTFASISGAIYGIYKDNELVDKLVTDDIGEASILNLPLGKYTVKELEPSIGYELDNEVYNIELTHQNKDIIINSKENVIKGKIILNKYYGDGNTYNKENDSLFEIYDSYNNLILSDITVDGKIEKTLDYGDYYVIQKSGVDNYSFVDNFIISIKEKKEYNFDLYDDILIVDVPNTLKNDYYRIYPIIFIIFGLILIFKSLKNTTDL